MKEQARLAQIVSELRAILLSNASLGVLTEPYRPPMPESDPHAYVPSDDADLDDGALAVSLSEPTTISLPPPNLGGLWDAVPVGPPPAATTSPPTESLKQIAEDLGDCHRCRLGNQRKHIVFGAGDPDADLMIIGEGPGEQEDLSGEPFVGPAGVMLDNMLKHMLGLSRGEVYLANIIKCFPPGNRKPKTDEAATCRAFVMRQIATVQPKLIVLLGDVALIHLTGTQGITSHRGQEFLVQGIPAIAMFHPAYLLRQPQHKLLAKQDLVQIKVRYDALGGRRGGAKPIP